MRTPALRSLLAAATLLAAAAPGPAAWAEPGSAPHCVYEEVDGLGPACPMDGGWQVLHSDGSVGFTHGTDPAPDPLELPLPGPADHAPERLPECITDPSTDYYGLVIYARAYDLPDRFAEMAPQIRPIVNQVNGHLNAEAGEFGATADYKMHCTGGVVTILNEALPTAAAAASFSTIVGDLRTKGYDSYRVKYWVWYDDTSACSCGGTGHIYNDDSLSIDNFNNGNPSAVSMYGVTFGYLSTRIMMHENGHNLGAVQHSAPNSSGGFHCNDGQDIMCYADGGSTSNYNANVCLGSQHFDCGHQDYFHPSPPGGSYLATHWNLGSGLNRYIVLNDPNDAPVMQTLSCDPNPSENAEAVACSFMASDDSMGVYYTVDWGDGSPATRVPASGTVPHSATQSASHTWDAPGTYTVSAFATDDAVPALASPAIALAQLVDPNEAPVMQALSCTPSPSDSAEVVTCSFWATDDGPDLYYVVGWGDGSPATRVPTSGTVTTGGLRSATHAWSAGGDYTVSVTATDTGTPVLSSAPITRVQQVDPIQAAPVMASLSCSPNPAYVGSTVSCSFRATDDSSGLYYTVYWGDGTGSTRVPATGYVAPGTTRSASHAWAAAGTFTVRVEATDNGVPVQTSARLSFTQTVLVPPCVLARSHQLTLGLLGLDVQDVSARTEANIPWWCSGKPFELAGSGISDFDVCWLAGATVLSCNKGLGPHSGIVPTGTTAARIVFFAGFDENYLLTAHEP